MVGTMKASVPAKKTRPLSQSFKDRANEACFWEAYSAAVLARAGLYVGHFPFSLSEAETESKGFSHDLDVSIDGLDPLWPIEVKSKNIHFTTTDDYPYEDVFVCSQNFFLRNWPGYTALGRDFLLVSTQSGAILWMPAGTPVSLGKEVLDSKRGELFKCVTCDKKYLRSLQEFVCIVRAGPGEN